MKRSKVLMKTWFHCTWSSATLFFGLLISPVPALISVVATAAEPEVLRYEPDSQANAKATRQEKAKHIVFIANDHEYRSEQTCPALARILAKRHGFRCTVLFGINDDGFIEGGAKRIPGLNALDDADLMVFFVRFLNLPSDQAAAIADYFERGGPVIGLRTSTHAFHNQPEPWTRLNYRHDEADYRGGLGEQIFGNTWDKKRGQSHYGTNHQMGSRVFAATAADDHPILTGVSAFHAYSGAYASPVPEDATELLRVQVLQTFEPSDRSHPDKPPVAAGWVRQRYTAPSGSVQNARVFYGSFGASEDLISEGCRRVLVNACYWALGAEDRIQADLDVGWVGPYSPSPYTSGAYFHLGVRPQDLSGWESPIMPSWAKLAGVEDPKMIARKKKVLTNRPELRQRLASEYPELYGEDATPTDPAKTR